MTGFNPFGTGEGLSASLGAMVGHLERGRWQAAIMLRKVHFRWPGWPLEHALAVVDRGLGIHQAQFLMMPPVGWVQKDEIELPSHLTTDHVIAEGLLPGLAMSALNEIFGSLKVYTNASMAALSCHEKVEQSVGFKATWKHAGLFDSIGDCLTLSLGDHAHVEFRAFMPRNGDLAERAQGWAKAYVRAFLARQLFRNAALGSVEPDQDDAKTAINIQALDELKILRKIEPRFGTVQAARDWYEKSPLPGFGSATAKQLVEWGQSNEVLEYIEAIDAGLHA